MKRLQKGEDGGSKSMDRISELPDGILQRILYFLSQKEAVQTCVLSKSWRYIWSTRPNLDFSDTLFNGNKHEFLPVVEKTLQRYCDQMLCVEEFHLCMPLGESDHGSVSLLEKWIPTLTNMGMKEFYLSIRSEQKQRLPSVVFGAQSLRCLHLEEFVLDEEAIEKIVLFKRLKTLHLKRVCIGADVFHKIISRCPLIETLSLEPCVDLRKIKVNELYNLKDFSFSTRGPLKEEHYCSIEIQYPQSLETLYINDGNIIFHRGDEFRNLSVLHLYGVKSSLDYLSSCKFPILTKLDLYHCDGLKGIELSIDAPNIKYFNYSLDYLSSCKFPILTKSLRYLHVEEFALDENAIGRIVLFKHLKTLYLHRVCIEDEVFHKIISCCPLIETLSLLACVGLRKTKVNELYNLKGFSFLTRGPLKEEYCSIEIQYPQSLETIYINNGNIHVHRGDEFRNLSVLDLIGIESSLDHLSSCKFPILKKLHVSRCDGLKGIELSIDAPNIKYFNYSGNFIPSISFATTTSSEWDSLIWMRSNDVSSSWFLKLKQLLRSLSQSNISLVTKYEYPIMIDGGGEHIIQENLDHDNHVVVYRLQINCVDLHYFPSLLNAFLRICRPRNIGDYLCITNKEFVEYLWKILMQRQIGDQLDQLRHEVWLQDLEQVTVEIYERDRKEWRSLTFSESPNDYHKGKNIATRFAAKWRKNFGESLSTCTPN